MDQDDIVYLDGFQLTYQDLGVDRDGLNMFTFGRVVPFMINDEMRSLYKRASYEKNSLTAAEQNRVLGRMPPEDEQLLCQKRLGYSREQLYEKARDRADELTMLECDMIVHSFDYNWRKMDSRVTEFERMRDLSDEDRDLVLVARSELQDAAYMKASAKRDEYTETKLKDLRRRRELVRASRDMPQAKWLQSMPEMNLPRWGFVVIRTADNDVCNDEAWDKFRAYYNSECERVLQGWRWKRSNALKLLETHESVFISDPTLNGASTEELRDWFKTKRGDLPEGVRRDCILVADETTLTNEWVLGVNGTRKPPPRQRDGVSLGAVDPEYDPFKPLATVDYGYESPQEPLTIEDLKGFVGEIRVPVHKVFDWLHYTLMMGTETWEERYKQTTQTPSRTLFPYTSYPEY